ncbi:hypothetical protein ABBQ32_000627 [Trebouxia sp. C0010 RCD-2024]
MALVLDPSPNHLSFEAVPRSDRSKVSRRRGDDSESVTKLDEYLGVLKLQNKTLQRQYDNLLFLATAPVKDELEIPDDLNFMGNTADKVSELQTQNHRLLAENTELTRQHDISLRSIVELKATVTSLQDALRRKQQSCVSSLSSALPSKLSLSPDYHDVPKAGETTLQELARLVAEQAATSKVETATVGTSPAQPAFGLATTLQMDPFQRELERSTPAKAFSSWLSSLSKAESWEELLLHRRTVENASRQSGPKPMVTPVHTKTKVVCTDDGLTPNTKAMMHRLSVLDPSTLPAPTFCTPLSAVEDASALSPETDAMLDILLSPSKLPPTPPPASLPAVNTSTALKPTSELQALQDSSLLLSPVAGTALRASPGNNLVCSLTQAAVEQEAVSPATASLVHWLQHPEAYPTPSQAQVDAVLRGVPVTNPQTPAIVPALTPTAKAHSQGFSSPVKRQLTPLFLGMTDEMPAGVRAHSQVQVSDNADQLGSAVPQRMNTLAQSLDAIAAPVMVGRTSSVSSDVAFSTSSARLAPSRADLATPANPFSSPDTLSPFDFSGMLCDIEDLSEFGSPAIFAEDLIPPARTPFTAQSTLTVTSLAYSRGLDSAMASVKLTVSPQDLPQNGFGSPLETMSESSTRTPASPQNCFQMKSYALYPGVDAAPAVSTSPLAGEVAIPASVGAMDQVLSRATPSTNQTWTSPCGWGSTRSAPNSPESFGYLVTPPCTPMELPLCENVTPSPEQQLLHNGGQAIVDRQSPARDISLRGLLHMRTGFGAEALHCHEGILADFYPSSPASAGTTSSKAHADPLVQRQLTPLVLGLPVTSPQTPAPSLCLTSTKLYSQVQVSDNADQLAMPHRMSTAAQSLNPIAAPVMVGRTSPVSSDFAFSTSPAAPAPSRADLATPAKPSSSPDAQSKTPDTLSPLDFSGMLCDIEDLTESGSAAIFAEDLIPPARTPFTAQSTLTVTSPAYSCGLDSALASVKLTVSPQDLPQDGFGSPLETMSESSTRTPASPQNCFQMKSYALSPGVDAAPPVSTSPLAGEIATPASVGDMDQVLSRATPPTKPGPPLANVTPSPEQQLLHSGGQAIVDRQSPARDISLRGLLHMRTGFGAEALHCHEGILADFCPSSPASAGTTSSKAPAGPDFLVQRQLTPLFLGVPVTSPPTPAPSLCLSPSKPHSQGRADASVGRVASVGMRRTPLGNITNLHDSPVMTQTNGTIKGSPSFAHSPVQKRFTPVLKAANPSRLRGLEVHQASTVAPAAGLLPVNRAGSKTFTPQSQLRSPNPKPSESSISSSITSWGGGGTLAAATASKKSSATRRASWTRTCSAERPAWSNAAPHSPAVSLPVSTPGAGVRSPLVITPAVRAPVVRARTMKVRQAAAQPSCAGTGVVTRAQTLAKNPAPAGSNGPNRATAARPLRHGVPATAGRATGLKVAEASSVAAKNGPAARVQTCHSASSRTDRQIANRRQPAAAAATKTKAALSGVKSNKQASSGQSTDAANRPADALVARKTRCRPALKVEVPTRVQPSRAVKQGWR